MFNARVEESKLDLGEGIDVCWSGKRVQWKGLVCMLRDESDG